MTVVALLAGPGTADRAVPLLALLGEVIEVVSWHAHRAAGTAGPAAPLDAVVATEPALLAEVRSTTDVGSPAVACFVHGHDDLHEAAVAGVEVVLTTDPALVERGAVLVPAHGVDVGRWPPLAPLVRGRWRRHLGLPERLVVGADAPLDAERPHTALAVASAAVVTGPHVALALALGTPVVTNAASVRRLGLRPGVDVELAARPSEAAALAAAIAVDDARAASLSRRGRRAAEHHLDLGRAARHLRTRLGLVATPPPSPVDRLVARLDELATPPRSVLRDRAAAALDPFLPAGALL